MKGMNDFAGKVLIAQGIVGYIDAQSIFRMLLDKGIVTQEEFDASRESTMRWIVENSKSEEERQFWKSALEWLKEKPY